MSRRDAKRFYAQSDRCPCSARLIERRVSLSEARALAHWLRMEAAKSELRYLLQESTTRGWNVAEISTEAA